MSKVAYITTGKIGIHRFTYNELCELEKRGINFTLCLTQLKKGPWMPAKNWAIVTASRRHSMVQFMSLLITKFNLLIKLIKEARQNNVISYLLMALSFYKQLKGNTITSIHCQMGDNKLYTGYFLKQLLQVPLTVTVHAHELYQRRVYDENESIRHLYANCDKVFTISQFNAEILKKQFQINPAKIEIMRLFPDIDYKHKVRNKTKILIVANWAEKKGYNILLDAISQINRNDFVIWVVGGSYYSENSIDVAQMIKEYQIEDKVALLGRQGGVNLDIIFSSCDIFCLPSYTEYYKDGNPAEREGIPVSLMEAMAWGKPVISTNHAGIHELVQEILVEEKSVNQLKSAIEYMLDHPEKWYAMGEKNKRIIAEKYSKENVKVLADTFKKW